MYVIRKEFHFEAGHHLEGLPVEHPCSKQHGHSYTVVVELRSKTVNEIGMIKDYRELKPIKDFLDEVFDHQYLNAFLKFNPTAELLARYLFDKFKVKNPKLFAVEVKETLKTSARYEED